MCYEPVIRAEHECLGEESYSHHVERVAYESRITALRELLPRSKTDAYVHDYSKYIGYSHYQ